MELRRLPGRKEIPLRAAGPAGGGRQAKINQHVAKLNSGNAHKARASARALKGMNASWAELHTAHQVHQSKLNQAFPKPKNLPGVPHQEKQFKLPKSHGDGLLGDIGHYVAHQAFDAATGNPMGSKVISDIGAGRVPSLSAARQDLESATGYQQIEHIRQHPIAGSVALAGILPFGKITEPLSRISEAGASAEKVAQAANDARGLRKVALQRRAVKLGRRQAPILTKEERDAHLAELSRQAMEDANVRENVARFRHEATVRIVEPGHVSDETGGEIGRIIRHGLSPNFKELGPYEKVGAKLDNPGARELRKQQDVLRHEALAEKSGKLRNAQAGAKNWDELLGAGSARAGALPAMEFKGFQALHPHMEDVRAFIQNLEMYPFDKQRLAEGIDAALHGHTPTEGEQMLMEKVFGRERAATAAVVKAGGIKEAARQLVSIPKAIKSSGDLSWGLRQGLFAPAHSPILFAKAFKGMFRPAFSEAEAQARMAALASHPYFPLLVKMGVPFTEIGSAEHGAANIANKEEAIMSNWAEHLHEMPGIRKVPGVRTVAKGASKIVRASDRGYVVPLNEIRFALGSQLLHQALENGWRVDGKLGKDIGGLVGTLTGRGDLGKWLTKHRASINAIFFSPGLMKSRINLLNPYWYMRMDPFARQHALRSLVTLASTMSVVLLAARMAGAKVELDPRSADFGKIRVGNTRIDIGGGANQYITLYSRILTQQSKSSTSGAVTNLTGNFGGQSDYDVLSNFFANKTSPVLSEGIAIAKQNRFGQKLTPTGELGNLFSPLLWNDMWQLAKSGGPGGGPDMALATFLPDLFGVGVQNYAPPKKKSKGSTGFGSGSGNTSFGGGSSSSFGR